MLNILPEKNDGNRHVINVYTLDDCVSIMFSDEQEMKIWLSELLDNQKGRSEDGRVPRPNYEQMWQVCTCMHNKTIELRERTGLWTCQSNLWVLVSDLEMVP